MKNIIFTNSPAETSKLLKEGYVVTSISCFSSFAKWIYCLEKDSAWSRMLGSK